MIGQQQKTFFEYVNGMKPKNLVVRNGTVCSWIDSSSADKYIKVAKELALTERQHNFLNELRGIISQTRLIEGFWVPLYAVYRSSHGRLEANSAYQPETVASLAEWYAIASQNGYKIGNNAQFVLYIASVIADKMRESNISFETAFSHVARTAVSFQDFVHTCKIMECKFGNSSVEALVTGYDSVGVRHGKNIFYQMRVDPMKQVVANPFLIIENKD